MADDKAMELASDVLPEHGVAYISRRDAQRAVADLLFEVSEAVKAARAEQVPGAPLTLAVMQHLERFILPDPVDPLADAIEALRKGPLREATSLATELREALAKRGLKIVAAD
jgi:hypothetical protein